jgi:xylulokinase
MEKYLLGIDLGSGGCKVTLLDTKSPDIITISREYPTHYPYPGWAEQDAQDWIDACSSLITEMIQKHGLDTKEIIAIGLSGVTHNPVLLDRRGELLGKVIHLTDTRSFRQSDILRERANELILERGLNNIDAMWTIAMLLWIRENESQRWNKIHKIIFPKDYLRYRLTGKILTDEIDAEGTLLYDPIKKRWDSDLCSLIGLDMERLPSIHEPLEIIGNVNRKGAEWSGLQEGTPVIAGTTDTALEVFVAGSIKPGDCTVKLATFGRICVITRSPAMAGA